MVGDGATDLEARAPGGADAFVCFGGVVLRENVAAGADWVVRSFDPLIAALPPLSAPHAPNVAADGASSSRSQQHA